MKKLALNELKISSLVTKVSGRHSGAKGIEAEAQLRSIVAYECSSEGELGASDGFWCGILTLLVCPD